jgi:uncharacterized membrane protein (DUF485 family)
MLHEAVNEAGEDHAAAYKSRLGLKMFAFYSLFYAAFVALNLVKPVLMEVTVAGGVNLATAYGCGLIVLALVMALIYNHLCSRREARIGEMAP